MRLTNLQHLELVNRSYFADHVDVSGFEIPYLPVYKSTPNFGAKKQIFLIFCVRIFLKNFSFILEFPFRYVMVS